MLIASLSLNLCTNISGRPHCRGCLLLRELEANARSLGRHWCRAYLQRREHDEFPLVHLGKRWKLTDVHLAGYVNVAFFDAMLLGV